MQFADEAIAVSLRGLSARRATPEDLGDLYARRGVAFLAVATTICGDAAPDAVQEAFVRALVGVGSLRARGALEAWVWRIVLNEARRRRTGDPLTRADASPPRPVWPDDASPAEALVRSLVADLPARQREVVFLRYFADLDEASIAAALGVRRGTVAATLHRVRTRLRAAIEQEGIHDDRD
jgi:RNA polymerase sigma factor (sigma-70 family)